MIIDFRLRPPFGDFLNSAQYNLERNAVMSRRLGMWQAESAKQRSMTLFLEEMDRAGISTAVMPGRVSAVFGNVSCDTMRQLMERWPGRFEGFAGVDLLDYDAAALVIEREVLNGPFAGLNIEPLFTYSFPLYADDRRIYPLYEMAQAAHIPVMIMSGGFGNAHISYTHPGRIDTVATDFPHLTIVTPHACWPHAMEIIQVALRKPNVHISPDIYSMGLPGSQDYLLAARTFLQDQFLFGSAHPTLPMEGCVDFYKKQGFTPEIWEKITWKNARRILELKGSSPKSSFKGRSECLMK